MVKKLLLLLLFLSGPFSAQSFCCTAIEVRAAASFPASQRYRSIYGDIQNAYEMQATNYWCGGIASWVNAGWLSKRGNSTGCSHTATRIQIPSLSFGGSYFIPLYSNIQLYTGLGVVFSQVSIKNKGENYSKRLSPGLAIKFGMNVPFCSGIFLDLFSDYYWNSRIYQTKVDVGGIKTGIGLGVCF